LDCHHLLGTHKMSSQSYDSNGLDHGPEVWVQKGGLEVDERASTAHPLMQNEPVNSKTGNPFGLRAPAFGLLVALATLVVVGAALGGGLGGALASERSKNNVVTATRTTITANSATASPAPTATPTTGRFTNLTIPAPSDVDTLFLDCPNLNSTAYSATDNDHFTFTCGVAYPGGFSAYSGGTIATLAGLIAYTPQDCAVACSKFNYYSAFYGNGTVCAAMTFNSELSTAFATYGANCWLFNTTGPPQDSSNSLSAVLQ
jgi:hypothetical protein